MRLGPLYVLAGVGLLGGLSVVLFEPMSTTGLNDVVGGALLVVAVASVLYMVAEHGGRDERGPDF